MNVSESSARERRRGGNGGSSKKKRGDGQSDDLRPEYDLSKLKLVRGKYFKRYWAGRSVVHLSPDVAKVFHDDEAVNNALRMLIKVADSQVRRSRRPA